MNGSTQPAPPSEPLALLLVEDSPADARLLQEALRPAVDAGRLRLAFARTLAEAITELRRREFCCALLDLGLPDARGVSNVEALRLIDPRVAVVVLTGLDSDASAQTALKLGAQDYVVKGREAPEELLKRIRLAVQRHRQLLELEDRHRRQFQSASRDQLTGLANRQLFEDRVQQALAHARRGGLRFALCYLDLDGFKAVNDQYGHAVGDALLKEVAGLLQEEVRESDTVARLGGDEFGVLLVPTDDDFHPQQAAQRIYHRLNALRQIGDWPLQVSCSVGYALYPEHGDHFAVLLHHSDLAMYAAKRRGAGVLAFDPQTMTPPTDSAVVVRDLATALAQDEFSICYQPWFDLEARRCAGVEVLLRWNHREGLRLPDQFLPAAERSGLLREIGIVVLQKACAQWRDWQRHGVAVERLSFNLSNTQLLDPTLPSTLLEHCTAAGLAPSQVQLELRCTALNEIQGVVAIERLRGYGFGVWLDRLGPECPLFQHLSAVTVDGVKLDHAFARALAREEDRASTRRFVVAALAAGAALDLPVVATGVESAHQFQTLKELGCRYLQGLWLGGYLSAREVAELERQGAAVS
ncbi:MAG: EAL domain-containing protein [Sinobacteraceae bacterium]|nr:EAL domain-containing protein [Nevskiaceae bacterium]